MRSVVILGEGTAGLLAAYFLADLNDVKITLISSGDIPTIGVGEGTVPQINWFFKNIKDFDWYHEDLNNTPKFGIKYTNWTKEKKDWIHGFGGFVAWHLSSSHFNSFLKKRCVWRGVEFIEGTVDKIEREPDSDRIKRLFCLNGKRISGDYFIDCSGFRRVLREGAEVIDFSKYLPCDRAIATHMEPKLEDRQPILHTTATALSNGWSWRIPLKDSVGVGYAYSSKFVTTDKALEEFEFFLGESIENSRNIFFNPQFLKEPLKGNCLSLGLSYGFFEPMEATNIWSIVNMVRIFRDEILLREPKSGDFKTLGLQGKFNKAASKMSIEFARYISAHYKLSDRDDSEFWRFAVNDMPSMKNLEHLPEDELFPPESWEALEMNGYSLK